MREHPPEIIKQYADSFAEQERLLTVGFSFLVNASGKLFTSQPCSLKDVEANSAAIYAVMVVSRGNGRYSCEVFKQAILKFYEEKRLFPVGLSSNMECVRNWAKKMAYGLQRLTARFTKLMRQAAGAKTKSLKELKERLLDKVDFTPAGGDEEDGNDEAEVEADDLSCLETMSELSTPASDVSVPSTVESPAPRTKADEKASRVNMQNHALRQKELADWAAQLKKGVSEPNDQAEELQMEPKSQDAAEATTGSHLVPHFVLKQMQMPDPPPPFAISVQYKKNREAVADELEPGADEKPKPGVQKKKKKRCPQVKVAITQPKATGMPSVPETAATVKVQNVVKYEPQEYSRLRWEFINSKKALGATPKQASLAWDLCPQKRELLRGVPLPELKRRRFVPKEATENPWS